MRLDEPDPQLGIFETILLIDGTAVELDAHLYRMETSALALYRRPLPPEARQMADSAARSWRGLGRLRLSVLPRDDGGLELEVETEVVEHDFRGAVVDRGTTLVPVWTSGGLGAHKWRDRSGPADRQGPVGAGEILLVDHTGEVLGAGRANLFVVDRCTLVTPRADGRLLLGVTRAKVLQIARSLHVPTAIESLPFDRLLEAEEVFLTGSIRGVEPVCACGGLASWSVGPVTLRLREALARAWLGAVGQGVTG